MNTVINYARFLGLVALLLLVALMTIGMIYLAIKDRMDRESCSYEGTAMHYTMCPYKPGRGPQ